MMFLKRSHKTNYDEKQVEKDEEVAIVVLYKENNTNFNEVTKTTMKTQRILLLSLI